MVADEDDDRAFFARNVVQCVSLAVGGWKLELRRRRTKNGLGRCCRRCRGLRGDKVTAAPTTQCGSKKVFAESLPKMGILPTSAGDFRQFLAIVVHFRSLETTFRAQ
jgi:hypothetical protein